MPFMFTRNAGITTEDIRNWPQSDERIPLDEGVLSFGKEGDLAAVVTKGAAMATFQDKYFTWDRVFTGTNRYDYLEVWDVE